MKSIVSFVILTFLGFQVKCLDNGLAKTPPMGWLSWERFRCITDCESYPADCIGERLIKETADRMAADGWLKAGYQYLTIDDCWPAKTRAKNGSLVGDATRFPHGMKYMGDYIHSRGLKFGIYEDFGTKTCGGYPGSLFYLQQDANTFASWGVDLVKFDGCYSDVNQQVEGYEVFGFYLNKTGRPILYSCSWPAYQDKKHSMDSTTLIKTCNMWRIFGDIQDSWDSVLGIINTYKSNPLNFQSWAGPGHWNDPDMLILGNYGLSLEQQRSQMAMWSMFAAPLIISTDLRKIANASKDILMNPRLIALNQDSLGQQALYLKDIGGVQVWTRKLKDPKKTAVAFLYANYGAYPAKIIFTPVLFENQYSNRFGVKTYKVYDIFTGSLVMTTTSTKSISVYVNPTGTVLYSFEEQ